MTPKRHPHAARMPLIVTPRYTVRDREATHMGVSMGAHVAVSARLGRGQEGAWPRPPAKGGRSVDNQRAYIAAEREVTIREHDFGGVRPAGVDATTHQGSASTGEVGALLAVACPGSPEAPDHKGELANDAAASAVKTASSTLIAPGFESGSLPLPHFGDCTQDGQPWSQPHDAIAVRVAVSQSDAT
jgi:hypothetical protein